MGHGIDGDFELEDDISTLEKNEISFEDLCGDAIFCKESSVSSVVENESWGLLDGQVLARVFHFLRTDIKSLVYANLTCKHWRSAVTFYKDISRQADLSSVSNCTDSMMQNIMVSCSFLRLLIVFPFNRSQPLYVFYFICRCYISSLPCRMVIIKRKLLPWLYVVARK